MKVLETDEAKSLLTLEKGVVNFSVFFEEILKLFFCHAGRNVADEQTTASNEFPRLFVLQNKVFMCEAHTQLMRRGIWLTDE